MAGDLDIGGPISVGSYEDRELIKDLYSRYAEATDADDAVAWAGTFTIDGSMFSPSHPSGRVTGRDALQAMCAGNSAWLADNGVVQHRHLNTNFRLSVHGDRAWGTCNIQYYWLRQDGTTELVGVGGYRDTMRKVDGQWYFESRDGYFDTDGLHMPGVEYDTEGSETLAE